MEIFCKQQIWTFPEPTSGSSEQWDVLCCTAALLHHTQPALVTEEGQMCRKEREINVQYNHQT